MEGEGGRGGVGAVMLPVLPVVLVVVLVVVVAQLREGARQLVAAAMQGSVENTTLYTHSHACYAQVCTILGLPYKWSMDTL